jgi:hypothetical protein
MSESPKRLAFFTAMLGLGSSLLFAALAERRVIVLGVLLGLLVGLLWGTAAFFRWTRTKSTRPIVSGYIVLGFLILATGPLVRGPETSCVATGYGLAQWVEMQIWERHHKKAITW